MLWPNNIGNIFFIFLPVIFEISFIFFWNIFDEDKGSGNEKELLKRLISHERQKLYDHMSEDLNINNYLNSSKQIQ